MPVNVIAASAVPSPEEKASPPVPESVITPFVPLSVTWSGALPASTSVIEIWLPRPALKTTGVSSSVVEPPGRVLTGASLIAPIVIVEVTVALRGPPAPLAPPSLIVSVSVSVGGGESVVTR